MAKQIFHVCHHCKDRQINCHSTCELYLKEVEENKKHLKEKRKQVDVNSGLYVSRINRLNSIRKNRHTIGS